MKPLYIPHPWALYSQKLKSRIVSPRFQGQLSSPKAQERQVRLVLGKAEGVTLFWLVDEMDGVIADASFEVFGPSFLIGAAEAACELIIRKNYQQVLRISVDLLDRQMRDKSDVEAFPFDAAPFLNRILEAIENGAEQCTDIPFIESYTDSPIGVQGEETACYEGWKELSKEGQKAVIEEVIQKEIRPYIELDAGGVQVMDIIEGIQVIISYEGACTSCYAATGSTLTAIQQILRAKVWPELVVIPTLPNTHSLADNSGMKEHDFS